MKNCKYFLILVLGLFCLIFCSCKNEPNAAESITGLWNFQSIEDFDCIDEELNNIQQFGNASCEEIDGEIHCLNGTANFINGTVTYTYNFLLDGILNDQVLEMGTYAFTNANDEQEMTICIAMECMIGNVSFTNSSIIFSSMDDICSHSFSAFK